MPELTSNLTTLFTEQPFRDRLGVAQAGGVHAGKYRLVYPFGRSHLAPGESR